MVSFGVTIPLAIAPAQRQDRDLAAKLAAVDKAEATLADARRTATTEYRTAASDVRRLGERLERFRQAVLSPAQQRTDAALASYRGNQATLMAVFGSNLRHGFEDWDALNRPYLLLAVLVAGLLFGMVLTVFITRPARRETRNIQSNSSNSRTSRSK